MDYSSWIANLQGRGFNTTGLSSGEANFADYGSALSNDIKSKVAQNGKTQADKELQALIASLFGGKSVMGASELMNIARNHGLNVKETWTSTSYIVDEKSSGTKGQKRVTQGSVMVYEITDSKGGKITIADANGNAFIEIEEVFMNEILSGVTSDITGGGASGQDQARIAELQAQQKTLEEKIKNAEISKEEAQEEIEKNKKEAEEEIERIDKEIEKHNDDTKRNIARLEGNAANYTQAEYAAEMAKIQQAGTSKINELNSNRALVQENLNQINIAAAKIATLNEEITATNATLADVSSQLPQATPQEGAAPQQAPQQQQMAGYAAAQGATGNKTTTAAQDYNALMLNISKQNAFSTQKGNTAGIEVEQNANIAGAAGLSEIQNVEDAKQAEEAKKEKEASEIAKEEKAKEDEKKLKEEEQVAA